MAYNNDWPPTFGAADRCRCNRCPHCGKLAPAPAAPALPWWQAPYYSPPPGYPYHVTYTATGTNTGVNVGMAIEEARKAYIAAGGRSV